MGVLEDHDHRLPARQAFELPDQRLQCPLLPLLNFRVPPLTVTEQSEYVTPSMVIFINRVVSIGTGNDPDSDSMIMVVEPEGKFSTRRSLHSLHVYITENK